LPILTVLSDLTLELVLTDTGGELYDMQKYMTCMYFRLPQ